MKKIQLVFLIGGFVLSAALLPTIFAGGGPVLSSCIITSSVLTAYTWAFAYQRQWLSALGVGSSALLWAILGVQAL